MSSDDAKKEFSVDFPHFHTLEFPIFPVKFVVFPDFLRISEIPIFPISRHRIPDFPKKRAERSTYIQFLEYKVTMDSMNGRILFELTD